jgi:hypothetical protein
MCDRAPPAAAAAAAAAAPAAAAAATPPGVCGATDGDTAKPTAPALQLLSWLGFGLTPGCCCSLLPAAAAAQGPSPSEQCAAAAVRRLNSIPLLCRCSRRLLLWRFRRERQLLHRTRHYSMLREHMTCSVAASARADLHVNSAGLLCATSSIVPQPSNCGCTSMPSVSAALHIPLLVPVLGHVHVG